MSNAPKYEPRTQERREADAKQNAPRYAREKRVNSILTAKYLKSKAAFDTYYAYDIADAFNTADGSWRDEKDPWLRFPDTLPEFLRGHTKERAGTGDGGMLLAADELQALAEALIRVAKVDWEGVGRDAKALDAEFTKGVRELVAQLAAEYKLPPSREEEESGDEDEE